MKENIACVVLAAGEGKRMKSSRQKVLHQVCSEPLVYYPVRLALDCGLRPVVVVVSPRGAAVRDYLQKRFGDRVKFAIQNQQLGTAHAVKAARPQLDGACGRVLVLYGDVPLLEKEDLDAARRTARKSDLVFLTCRLSDPTGYGRVIRRAGRVEKILEQRDASPEELKVNEVNAGIYLVKAELLWRLLSAVRRNNQQKEYYLTDIVALAIRHGIQPIALERPGAERILGVNDRNQLQQTEQLLNLRLCWQLMQGGVTIHAPTSCLLGPEVEMGADCEIFPGCHFRGRVRIGSGCKIGPYAVLEDCELENEVEILPFSSLAGCTVRNGARVGPFARLRPGADIGRGAHVGNFVEVKNTLLGEGAKANHLTYLGDAKVGPRANIGAGTITCNYDGYNKYRTTIGAGAFIGSDTQLVAPVKVGEGAVVGAGTTVTVDVPPDALAVSRVPQKNLPGWARRRRSKK